MAIMISIPPDHGSACKGAAHLMYRSNFTPHALRQISISGTGVQHHWRIVTVLKCANMSITTVEMCKHLSDYNCHTYICKPVTYIYVYMSALVSYLCAVYDRPRDDDDGACVGQVGNKHCPLTRPNSGGKLLRDLHLQQ